MAFRSKESPLRAAQVIVDEEEVVLVAAHCFQS